MFPRAQAQIEGTPRGTGYRPPNQRARETPPVRQSPSLGCGYTLSCSPPIGKMAPQFSGPSRLPQGTGHTPPQDVVMHDISGHDHTHDQLPLLVSQVSARLNPTLLDRQCPKTIPQPPRTVTQSSNSANVAAASTTGNQRMPSTAHIHDHGEGRYVARASGMPYIAASTALESPPPPSSHRLRISAAARELSQRYREAHGVDDTKGPVQPCSLPPVSISMYDLERILSAIQTPQKPGSGPSGIVSSSSTPQGSREFIPPSTPDRQNSCGVGSRVSCSKEGEKRPEGHGLFSEYRQCRYS